MIYKIKKDKCYKITGSLVLNNRYSKVEGNSFSSGYAQTTLGNDYANPTGYDEITFVHNEYSRWKINDYWTEFAFRYYYKEYAIGTLTSNTIMDLNVSSFSTKVTYDGGTKTARNYSSPETPIPNASNYISYDPSSGFNLSKTLENMKKLFGNCSVQYNDISLYSVTPVIKVVYKIELLAGQSSSSNNVPTPSSVWGTVEMDQEIQYTVLSTNLYQSSSNFESGENSSLETYSLSDNTLFDIDSKRNNTVLIEEVANTILKNYKKGKQVVKIECPVMSLQTINDSISNNHIFETGQYFYILDELDNSLFYYKLTNVPKLFELISAQYLQESWNLVLKEVAKN